jgi:hypothetical protein
MRRILGFCAVQLMLVLVAGFNLATAQDEAVPVECGSIVEGEFTTTSRIHRYALELSPGDTVTYTLIL